MSIQGKEIYLQGTLFTVLYDWRDFSMRCFHLFQLAVSCMALLVATAGQLQAAVININLAAAGTNSVNITGLNAGKTFGSSVTNVNGFIGTNRLRIRFDSSKIGFDPENNMTMAINGGSTSPHRFGAGATIDGSFGGSWSSSNGDTSFNSDGDSGSFSPDFGANSFIGFRAPSGVGFIYGYIEVRWNWTGTSSTSSFQLLSAAYEDQVDTAIVTPAGSVPEPTSMAIFGLGALGMAYRARRKSKCKA
jgi:hypothetical protein